MTAINIIRTRHTVHMLTDGSGYEGNQQSFSLAKAFPQPHLSAVIAVSGAIAHGPLLATGLGMAATSYDDLKAIAVRAVQEMVEFYTPVFQRIEDPRFVIVVAGISESSGPDAYVITNDPRVAEPWTTQQIGGCTMIPADAATQAVFHAAFGSIEDSEELDPERDGIRMMEIQRRNPAFGIGAFAQLTTVTLDGITTRVIHRWADTAGRGERHAV